MSDGFRKVVGRDVLNAWMQAFGAVFGACNVSLAFVFGARMSFGGTKGSD